MTRDPERDRLAVAKQKAMDAYNAAHVQTDMTGPLWDAFLDAWEALHSYDRAKWNETHPDIPITPEA